MRNTICVLAAVCEIMSTLVLLPIALFYRPAWFMQRLDRLVSGVAVIAWVARHGR